VLCTTSQQLWLLQKLATDSSEYASEKLVLSLKTDALATVRSKKSRKIKRSKLLMLQVIKKRISIGGTTFMIPLELSKNLVKN
jgi:hypothetical protein